jgi:hypothetical protein
MEENNGKCPAGKTADDCPERARFKESVLIPTSGHCRYPERVERKQRGTVFYFSKDVVPGPYYPGEEARFKRDVLKMWEARLDGWRYFCIESPDTAAGFPDVLAANDRGKYELYEFKVSDDKGVLKFEKTQPLFYKQHSGLRMMVVAWDVPKQSLAFVSTDHVVAAKSLWFRLPEKAS